MAGRLAGDFTYTNSKIENPMKGCNVSMDEARDKIITFLSRYIRIQELPDDADIFELGFVNSLFAMQLVTWVEQEFDITVEDDDLELSNFNSVSAIVCFVQRKTAAAIKE